jgi:hypothetical protein
MFSTSIARRIGRGLVALTFVVAMVSLTSPGTAYAKHGNGAAIALGILGGALAGAAIASSTAPGYYAAPPAYYYPYAPPVYSVAPAPAYSYALAAAYYGQRYYHGGYSRAPHPSLARLVAGALFKVI